MTDYRTRIYKNYASLMQDATHVFNEDEALRWGKAYDFYIKDWLPKQQNSAILDVACGGGKLLYFFRSKGYNNIQGVDISPEQIILSSQVTNNVINADAIEFLGSKKDAYDLITALDIIEHFKKNDVLKFLDACYDALKIGGRLILQTTNAESLWGMNSRYGDFTHEIAFTPNSLERLLALVGFSHVISRETGPSIHSVVSLGRYVIWKVIRLGLIIWNLAETGTKGSGIYTRIFVITGIKGVQ